MGLDGGETLDRLMEPHNASGGEFRTELSWGRSVPKMASYSQIYLSPVLYRPSSVTSLSACLVFRGGNSTVLYIFMYGMFCWETSRIYRQDCGR